MAVIVARVAGENVKKEERENCDRSRSPLGHADGDVGESAQ